MTLPQSLFDDLPLPAWVFDRHTLRFLAVNDAAVKHFGYSHAEFLSMSIVDLRPAEDVPLLLDVVAHQDADTTGTWRLRRKDGEARDAEVTARLVHFGGREARLAMVQDVTERKRVDRELRQNAEQLRLALDAGRMGTWEWTIGAREVRWSAGLEVIHGRTPGSFPGTFEAFQEDIHPDDRERVLRTVAEAVEHRREHHVEYRIVRPDGAVRWVEGRGRLFLDAEGRPDRMVGVCTDVTERKQAEDEREQLLARERAAREASEAAQARLDFVGQIARSITAALDLDTVLQRIVEGAQALCGSDTGAIFLRDGDSEAMVPRYRVGPSLEGYRKIRVEPGRGLGGQVLSTGRPARTADYLADGRISADYHATARATRTIALMVVPLLVANRVEGLLYVSNTTARAYTDEDETVCARLAEQAAIAIRNAQLFAREQAAHQEAEAANHAKDEFLAVLSHELRTPLTAMLGWVRVLRTGQLDSLKQAHALETIERNTLTQVRMIDDLLDMSRIVAGTMSLDRRPIGLGPVVAETVESFRQEVKAKGLTLELLLDHAAGTVFADPHRIRQVLGNLFTNALRYTPPGGRVEVQLTAGDDVIRLVVRDTGIGIQPDLLPHVFERFRQADWRQAGTQGGLGLGLAIVHQLVELHGGSVEAASDGPGQGAAFTVTLPLVRAIGSAD